VPIRGHRSGIGIGEDNSGKLVTLVRREARRIAEREGAALLINDGPPGIGCPATAAIAGTDVVLIVTEPTVSGLNDLRRVIGLCCHFRLPMLVYINKYDLNQAQTALIQQECRGDGVPVVGLIPFEPAVSRALVARQTVVDFDCGPATAAVIETWDKVQRTIAGPAP
jgi:MinD superfamily P-loop ATPase